VTTVNITGRRQDPELRPFHLNILTR